MALTNGLVVMTPSSVAKTGTGSTATINSDGSVVFSACTALSLNGVFTSSYDNYMIAMQTDDAGAGYNYYARLRASGTDEASGSNYYTRQSLYINGTSITAGRSADSAFRVKETGTSESGLAMYLFGPYLSQPTACRTVVVDSANSAGIYENANTHSLSNSYDGITMLSLNSISFTGLLTVFGFNQ
jgi:hypothetical protein